jgi:hypothetical protein
MNYRRKFRPAARRSEKSSGVNAGVLPPAAGGAQNDSEDASPPAIGRRPDSKSTGWKPQALTHRLRKYE